MRAELGETTLLYLTPGTDRCLELHTQTSLQALAMRANQSSGGSRNLKSFSRLFYAQAELCELDASGRIRIPQNLAGYADLTKEIVIVGVGLNWEVWNVEQWQSYLLSHADEFDQISQNTFDGLMLTEGEPKKPMPLGKPVAVDEQNESMLVTDPMEGPRKKPK